MFSLKRKSNETKYNLCMIGRNIFKEKNLNQYLDSIKSLVSCPNAIYEQLYLATLHCLAEFCQAMAFSKESYNKKFGLLERQLQLAETALKIRRGILLPKGATIERISVEEAQWTYALFAGSLFKDLNQIESDREVILYDSNNERIGTWLPLSGSLYEPDTYYDYSFMQKKALPKGDIFGGVLIGRIIPPTAIRWLAENENIFTAWWEVMLNQSREENSIETIIYLAAQKIGINLNKDNTNRNNIDANQEEKNRDAASIENLVQAFINWVVLRIDLFSANIFRIKKGIFIEKLIIDQFCIDNEISHNKLITDLMKNNLTILNEIILVPKKMEDQRKLYGWILNINSLPEQFNKLPLENYFQEDIL